MRQSSGTTSPHDSVINSRPTRSNHVCMQGFSISVILRHNIRQNKLSKKSMRL